MKEKRLLCTRPNQAVGGCDDVVEDTLLDEDDNLVYDHASIQLDDTKIPAVVFTDISKDDSAKSWVEPIKDIQGEVKLVGEGLQYVKDKLAESSIKVEAGAKSTMERVVDIIVENHHELAELKTAVGNINEIAESHVSVNHALSLRDETVEMIKNGMDNITKDTTQLRIASQTQAVNVKALKGSTGTTIKTLAGNVKAKMSDMIQRIRVLESVTGVGTTRAQASAVDSPGLYTSAGDTSGANTPTRNGISWSGGGGGGGSGGSDGNGGGFGGYGNGGGNGNSDGNGNGDGHSHTDLNTVLGYDEKRGCVITLNVLLAEMTQLSAQNTILLDRTSSAGAGAGKFWWNSKSDFRATVMKDFPSGESACAFLDVCSLFIHGSFAENDPTTWLQEHANSNKAGFQTRMDSKYANTFRNRYPVPLIGSAKNVLPGQTLSFIATVGMWRGEGGNDGKREQLLKALNLGYEHARQYAREALPPGQLQDLALVLASKSIAFITSLFNYLEDEITKLIGIGITPKSVLLLASNQVMHIFESFYNVRQHARETVNVSPVDLFISQVWATLQCHKVMQEYTKLRFKHHPAIASAYMRFLTQETGANSSAVLAKKLNDLTSKYEAIKDALDKHGKDALKRHESVLNTVITANNLKRK